MGLWFSSLARVSTPATAASGTRDFSQPRKKYGVLRRLRLFTCIGESQVEVLECFGKYRGIARPGFHCFVCCLGYSGAGYLRTNLQHQEISLQYRVVEGRLYEAFYSLEDPVSQVTSYVLDAVGSAVSNMQIEDVFTDKPRVARTVQQQLGDVMHAHGFKVEDCLITVLTPIESVKEAMGQVLASRRQREAAIEQGEAEKVKRIKEAEASSAGKYLQGQGFARFLVAFAAGAHDAVRAFFTGKIKEQDLSFPPPPPADEASALAAAGVHQGEAESEEASNDKDEAGHAARHQVSPHVVRELAQHGKALAAPQAARMQRGGGGAAGLGPRPPATPTKEAARIAGSAAVTVTPVAL